MPLRKVLICGLPGAGKTTLAGIISQRLNAVLFNADKVRANLNRDLGFSIPDRIEQAKRMGWLCDQVTKVGQFAIADFVCPTSDTRRAFGEAYVVWVDRITESRFADTNAIFTPPERFDIRITADGAPEAWAEQIVRNLQPVFDPKAPAALFLGRYQPFHQGHRALILEGIRRVGQACIAVRNTSGLDAKNPFSYEEVCSRIDLVMARDRGRFIVIPVPNVTDVFYGRDVGYNLERIDLDSSVQAISGTRMRELMGMPRAVNGLSAEPRPAE